MIRNNIVGMIFVTIILLAGFMLLYNQPSFTGFAVDSSSHLQKLKVASMCSAEPEIYQVWQVWNKNNLDLDFSWNVDRTNQTGVGLVLGNSYSYFNTTRVEGENIARIFLNGIEQDFAKSKEEKCVGLEECIESWACSDWSECTNESQTRICEDINDCNTSINLPLLLRECVVEENQAINETQYNQTESNETQNQTFNETGFNQTTNETQDNQTNNETNQSTLVIETVPVTESVATGGGGGSEGGVRLSPKEVETTQKVVKEEVTAQEPQQVMQEQLPEPKKSFISIVGSTIKLPLDNVRGFLEGGGINSTAVYAVLLVIIFLVIVTLVYNSLKAKKNN